MSVGLGCQKELFLSSIRFSIHSVLQGGLYFRWNVFLLPLALQVFYPACSYYGGFQRVPPCFGREAYVLFQGFFWSVWWLCWKGFDASTGLVFSSALVIEFCWFHTIFVYVVVQGFEFGFLSLPLVSVFRFYGFRWQPSVEGCLWFVCRILYLMYGCSFGVFRVYSTYLFSCYCLACLCCLKQGLIFNQFFR